MTARTTGQVIGIILKAIPYPEHISEINLTNAECVCLKWRNTRFRIDLSLHVEEMAGQMLAGSDIAILFRRCLEQSALLAEA
jgi:hypothetical protein